MLARYKEELRQLIEEANCDSSEFSGEINVCVALYFASYFQIKNLSCRKYLHQFRDAKEGGLVRFIALWDQHEKARLANIKEKVVQRFTANPDFESYFAETKRVEEKCMSAPKKF